MPGCVFEVRNIPRAPCVGGDAFVFVYEAAHSTNLKPGIGRLDMKRARISVRLQTNLGRLVDSLTDYLECPRIPVKPRWQPMLRPPVLEPSTAMDAFVTLPWGGMKFYRDLLHTQEAE